MEDPTQVTPIRGAIQVDRSEDERRHPGDEGGGMGQYTMAVTNPDRRDLILNRHPNLTREDAEELIAIYLALGYAHELLSVTSEEQRVAA